MNKTKVIRVEGGEENLVHIQPNGSHDPAATLCFEVDTGASYIPTNKKVSCLPCQDEFEALRHGLKITSVIT